MGFLDDAKKRLSSAYGKHGHKIDQGLDRAAKAAADFDRKKTGGKNSAKIAQGVAKAREGLHKLDDRDGPAGPAGPGSPGPQGPRR